MGGLPLTLTVALTSGQHYRAACDRPILREFLSHDFLSGLRTLKGKKL